MGDVSLRLADGSTPAAAVGLVLHSLDTVSTAAGASATLRFADGSLVLLAPNSKLTLQQLQVQRAYGSHNTTLHLHEGGAEAQVRREPPRPRFEIKSPSLNLGARGTDFRTRFDPTSRQAHGEVTSGLVAATSSPQHEVLLGSGFGITGAGSTLGGATALLPAPDLSGVAARLQHLPLHLAWAPMADAQAWRAQIYAASNSLRLLLEGRFDTPLASFADLPDGDYVLRVRAADAQGLEGSVARTNFTLKARPEPPFLREPPPAAVRIGDRTRFVWTLSSAAAQYRLQIAADPDFASPVLDRADLGGPSIVLPQAPGRWYWRLASVRAGGDQGPWSDAQNYELQALPPPPPPVAEGVKVDGRQIQLRWASGDADDRFEFQIAKDAAFSELVAERRIGAPQATLDSPPPGRYYVRSRTVDARGLAGPWGATNEFEVGYSLWWWLAPALLLLLL